MDTFYYFRLFSVGLIYYKSQTSATEQGWTIWHCTVKHFHLIAFASTHYSCTFKAPQPNPMHKKGPIDVYEESTEKFNDPCKSNKWNRRDNSHRGTLNRFSFFPSPFFLSVFLSFPLFYLLIRILIVSFSFFFHCSFFFLFFLWIFTYFSFHSSSH